MPIPTITTMLSAEQSLCLDTIILTESLFRRSGRA